MSDLNKSLDISVIQEVAKEEFYDPVEDDLKQESSLQKEVLALKATCAEMTAMLENKSAEIAGLKNEIDLLSGKLVEEESLSVSMSRDISNVSTLNMKKFQLSQAASGGYRNRIVPQLFLMTFNIQQLGLTAGSIYAADLILSSRPHVVMIQELQVPSHYSLRYLVVDKKEHEGTIISKEFFKRLKTGGYSWISTADPTTASNKTEPTGTLANTEEYGLVVFDASVITCKESGWACAPHKDHDWRAPFMVHFALKGPESSHSVELVMFSCHLYPKSPKDVNIARKKRFLYYSRRYK
jgi:hypothetical protein